MIYSKFEDLKGQTITEFISHKKTRGDQVEILTKEGNHYLMFHLEDCCERVSIESIVGDIKDLLDSPILLAEEVTSRNINPPEVKAHREQNESFTWTFYKLSTIKGSVTIRWYGDSNGAYSERVDFMIYEERYKNA